jgi:hypothetical protein
MLLHALQTQGFDMDKPSATSLVHVRNNNGLCISQGSRQIDRSKRWIASATACPVRNRVGINHARNNVQVPILRRGGGRGHTTISSPNEPLLQ